MRVVKHIVELICFILLIVAQPLSSQGGIGVFEFSTSAISVSEDSGTLDIVIENTGDISVAAVLRISTTDITARIYEDFLPSPPFVQFSSGDRTRQYSLGIIDDALSEGNEMFALDLTLLGATNPSVRIGENSKLTVTLVDDEQPPSPTTTTSTPVSVSSQDSGGNITLSTEAKIEVVCDSEYIEVTLQRADYPGLLLSNGSDPHLDDEKCVPGFIDETLVRFTFGLEQCNTEKTSDDDNIVYKNNVYLQLNLESNDSAITREHRQQIPFQCSFHKKATISKVSYSPRVTKVLTDAENFGNFTYFMDMYEDEDNTEKVETYPKEVGLGQQMYFGFRVESGDSKLFVFPDVCKATLSSDYDATPDHLIIESACSRDNTLQYNYEQSASHYFNVAAFRFKEGYDDVFIHCKLTVCREDDQESRCAKGCEGGSRRRRRRALEEVEEGMSANLYIGPVNFSNRRERDTVKEDSDPRNVAADSNSMVVIVAVLVGVLAVGAVGLIVALVIVTKRHRYQSAANLIVSEDM